MTEAGLTKIREAKKSGEWFKKASPKRELVIPLYTEEALTKNKRALDNFNRLAKSYKRQYVGWIASAKREERARFSVRLELFTDLNLCIQFMKAFKLNIEA